MDIKQIVFIDECGIHIGMTRLYGRGANYERVADYTPDVRFESDTLSSSIRANCETVPPVFEGALNGELLRSTPHQCLSLTLEAGNIVVMGSLSSHKVKGVIDPIIAAESNSPLFAAIQFRSEPD